MKNITHAAANVFITQSALNQQLLKLEKELGTSLFIRSRTDWRPTAAGEVYLKNANELLRIKKETYNIINDIAEIKKGNISVGFTPGRGIPMFTKIYPNFHTEYPNIVVTPLELSVKKQQELITKGDMDIGILSISESNKANHLQYRHICHEDIVLAIPLTHPYAKSATRPFSVIDIKKFESDSFVVIYKESTLWPILDNIFESAGFKPKILFETANNAAIITLIQYGICCGIVPYYYVKDHLDTVACFYLPDNPKWNLVACYLGGSYLTLAAKRFIELAANYWIIELNKK